MRRGRPGRRHRGAGRRTGARRGADHFADGGALIWLGRCRDIRFEGNTVIAPGACFGQVFHLAPTATDVRGMDDGVRR